MDEKLLLPLLQDALSLVIPSSQHFDLSDPCSWNELARIRPKERAYVADELKKKIRLSRYDQYFDLHFLSGVKEWDRYALRLCFHAYWTAWNLILDRPKRIDPELDHWTQILEPMQARIGSADFVTRSIEVGLQILERRGVAPKLQRPILPGDRGYRR